MRVRQETAAVIAGATGGACSLLAVAYWADWRLGEDAACPTLLGFVQMAIIGALCGAVWGAFGALFVRPFAGQARAIWFQWALAIAGGLVFGTIGAPFCLPLHFPIELRLR